MTRRHFRAVGIPAVVLVAALVFAASAFAQGGATSTIQGSVADSTGAVLPGADVQVKNVATGASFSAVSGGDGAFVVPAIPPGTYTVTVTLMGFKTAVLNDVIANVAQTAVVKATLEIGALEETVVVTGASEIVQTQATAVAATLSKAQIASLPVVGRGAFELVGYMPGISTTTGSLRDGTVNGLPQSAVNITLDGMNIQDNYAKSWDGMFTRVSPRLDAVEEVTVSTAAQGADMGSQGAAQVRFVTRSGTNSFQGSAYFYYRREWLNTNTWFNLYRNVSTSGVQTPKTKLFQDQPGFRVGGPIIRDKAFYFLNYEWISSPGTRTDNRTIMNPNSERGLFQYSGGMVDLMALAARNGQVSRIDPAMAKLVAAVRGSAAQGSVTPNTDLLTETLSWQQDTESTTKYPTLRLDYNVTSKHRLTVSGTYNHLVSDPDTTNSMQPVFPGSPIRGLQDSERYTAQISLRSTLTSSMVNEFRIGATGGATLFSPNLTADMFNDYGGYAIGTSPTSLTTGWGIFRGLSNPNTSSTNSSREGSTRVIEDTLNWLRGRHSLVFGGSVTRGDVWLKNRRHVPALTFGMATGDPADTMFNTTNFPGASSTDITNARNLYAVLTGRVTTITRDARVGEDGNEYVINGESLQKGRMWQLGFFVQDGWRWKPSLTVNAGLRYEVQLPFYALNNSYSFASMEDIFGPTGMGSGLIVGSVGSGLGNLYKPGTLQGAPTMYEMLTKDTPAFNTDRNNVAPSIGAAWTTGAEGGLLRTIFGAPGDSVIRGGFNIAFQRGGMSDFTEVYGDNPGILIDATRNQANGNLGPVPVLLSSGNLGAPNIPLQRVYPMAVPSRSSNVRAFDPNIKLPYAMTGTVGLQRALGRNTSFEVRYIFTKSADSWTLRNLAGALNYNEINVVENGFLNEFRVAQANLVANVAAGRGSTFAYTGAPGTSPLPIFLAHLNGSKDTANPAAYSGTNWTNTTLVQALFPLNPNPQTAASNLNTNYFTNMTAAGLPVNFWQVNPYVTNSTVVTNGGDNHYNGVQLILNRRYWRGLQVMANYTFGVATQEDFYSWRVPYKERQQTYSNGSAGLGTVRHNLSATWLYDLPFGQGKRWGGGAGGAMNRLIGDWSIMGTMRWQSGRTVDFGNVRLNGFTIDELQKFHKLYKTQDPNNQYRTLVWMLPQDVIDNTIKAYSLSATGYTAGAPTGKYFSPANGPDCLEQAIQGTNTQLGYGACGTGSVVVTGPSLFRTDITIAKRVKVVSRVAGEFQIMIFNLFKNVNFNPVGGTLAPSYIGSIKDNYQVTGAVDSSRTAQLAFRVSW
jgi:hypothetical protein